jgi:hypothetical protein
MDLLEANLMSMDLIEATIISADLLEATLNLLDQLEDMLIPCRHGRVSPNLGGCVRGCHDIQGPIEGHYDFIRRGVGHPEFGGHESHDGGHPEPYKPRRDCVQPVWMLSRS